MAAGAPLSPPPLLAPGSVAVFTQKGSPGNIAPFLPVITPSPIASPPGQVLRGAGHAASATVASERLAASRTAGTGQDGLIGLIVLIFLAAVIAAPATWLPLGRIRNRRAR